MTEETQLLRQVHPSWVREGRITSQVFAPTTKDERRLSVYDGDQISAENAWNHFTGELGCSSVGIVAVTVGECHTYSLRVISDPTSYREHALIDFTGNTDGQIKTKAKLLKCAADVRGWLFRASVRPC